MAVIAMVNGRAVTFDVVLECGRPILTALEVSGEEMYAGLLLRIEEDGRFYREPGINEGFGFKLNNAGQIKQVKGE